MGEADHIETIEFRQALGLDKPYESYVPRANEPAGELTVLRVWPDDLAVRLALGALQGMLNRERPQLYIGIDKPLNWLEYHSGKIIKNILMEPSQVFEKFKDRPKGIVIYDSSVDGLGSIAVTYAGLEDLIPATPELAETLSAKYGWKIVHDLRGRWQSRLEAYQWAFDNLFPRCNRHALMHFNHGFMPEYLTNDWCEAGQQIGFNSDYAVAFRLFVWHIGSEPVDGEFELATRIMESVPLYTPVVGASSGLNMYIEPYLVAFIAKYANLYIPFGPSNVTVLSGARVPDKLLKQQPLPVRQYEQDRIYVTFTNSEHDNMEHLIGGGPPWQITSFETDDPYRMWWCDPMRGKVAMGWPIGPLVCELSPATLTRMVMTATENDYFMASLSGLGLTSLPDFAGAYPDQQDELVAGYAKLTMKYMKRLGWTLAHVWGQPGSLNEFLKSAQGLEGLFEGYGVWPNMTYEKSNYVVAGKPVFHSLTVGSVSADRKLPLAQDQKRRAKALAKQITSAKVTERPAFIHAFTLGWDYGPTILKMTADLLPPEYVIVRPDEFVALYKEHRTGGGQRVSRLRELDSTMLQPDP